MRKLRLLANPLCTGPPEKDWPGLKTELQRESRLEITPRGGAKELETKGG